MISAGIDIGSRTIKLALLEDGKIASTRVEDTTFDPLAVCRKLLNGASYDRLVCTGYGRRLFADHWTDAETITEIKAVARGVHEQYPGARVIIDIGGQDSKAVLLDANGRVVKFAMNDRCAAGTGRFLEVMATALSYGYPEFMQAAEKAEQSVQLSSMCTVFAESEVISLVGRGEPRDRIALGIHHSIVKRTKTLLRSIPLDGEIVFTGGGAWNTCLRTLLEQELKHPVVVPENPQVVAALGCGL